MLWHMMPHSLLCCAHDILLHVSYKRLVVKEDKPATHSLSANYQYHVLLCMYTDYIQRQYNATLLLTI